MEPGMDTEYRALAARTDYLALDRADIQYAVKGICRGMARPTLGDKRKLKRLARYLKENPRVVSMSPFQGRPGEFDGFSDSDWAGCHGTAKSTSGGAIQIGSRCIKTWSSTQKSITLCSGETELVAAVKMCKEFIGVTQLAYDWGVEMGARVHVDSSAAIGVAQRKGNGNLRHVRVGMLWIQEEMADGEVDMIKIQGEENPANLTTKHLTEQKIRKHISTLNQEFEDGRAEKSLQIGSLEDTDVQSEQIAIRQF